MCALTLATLPCASAQQEQTAFRAEDSAVKNPVALPADVLELLKNDPCASAAFEEKDPAASFSASAIRLGPRMTDLIVKAVGNLSSGNVCMFWVFLQTAHGHRLVFVSGGHDLIVESKRTNGYRDITTKGTTAGTLSTDAFKFNGTKYALYRQTANDIP
jgi:hypothetical protein